LENALHSLREFLFERVYDNPVVHNELVKAEKVLEALWQYYARDNPEEFRRYYWPDGVSDGESRERAVADF